jgi:dihydrofolate reductase
MKTQYYTASSLDGFIATEDHSLEWLSQLGDVNETSYPEFIKNVRALAMASSTYEGCFGTSSSQAASLVLPWPYSQPAWVFSSRSLPSVAGANLHFVRGDVRPVHDLMRQAAGDHNIWLVGGGDLVETVDDPDAHCQRARAASAKILMEPQDMKYGARNYIARDLEGHIWSFGAYRPKPHSEG